MPGQVDPPRDGSIDFSRYSSEQLHELRMTLNQNAFPLNYANLLAELDRRTAEANSAEPRQASLEAVAVPVRFTPHGGLRGWLEAKSRRLELYGEGFAEIRPQELALGGWQRNWLGIGERTEAFIPIHDISDVIQGDGGSMEQRREGNWVRLRYETALGRYRFVEFQAGSIDQASELVGALPKARSDGYERWTAVREFDARLREVGSRPLVTYFVVFANVAVFAAMALAIRHFPVSVTQAISWGANFAPLTLHGQWWRLLSALFLHGSLPHVLFNMWALWNVGRLTERLYGNGVYAFLYFACGILAGLTSIVWDPGRATLGASGAVFGIFAAFILFALHPRSRVAVRVPATLWISTAVFALYNLVGGFFTTGIDNAAHVGGFISGLMLGACLVRPVTAEARSRFPRMKALAATGLTAIIVTAAIWQVRGFGDQLTGPERYLRAHTWYINDEVESLRKWQEIAVQAGLGQLSGVGLAERFEREIVPFWETASARLKQEEPALPIDQREYGSLAADYSRLRLDWARAVVDLGQGNEGRLNDAKKYQQDSELLVAQSERLILLANLSHRPRSLVNSPWMSAARNWFAARRWKCVEAPAWMSTVPDPGDAPLDGPAARRAAGCRAQRLFMFGDYLTLDHWMEQSEGSIDDLPDGGSTLDGIVGGLSHLFEYGSVDVAQALGRTVEWHRLAANSAYPELIQSLIFESWAWMARGHGYVKAVSPQNLAIFTARAEMAAMGLRVVVERASTNPLWYQLSLDVGLDQSKAVDELRSTFNRGIVEKPDYWPLYRRMLRILMPRWLGSEQDIHRFINEASRRPNGETNFAKYARLYWSYSALERDDVSLFSGSLAAWSTMKAGFLELRRQYPKSDSILNAYAKFACTANDGSSYGEVRSKLRNHFSSTSWSDKVSLKICDERFPAIAAAARGHTFEPGGFRPP